MHMITTSNLRDLDLLPLAEIMHGCWWKALVVFFTSNLVLEAYLAEGTSDRATI